VGLGTVVSFTGVWAEELCPCLHRLPLRPYHSSAVHVVKADAPLSLLPNGKRNPARWSRARRLRDSTRLFGALVMVVISGAWLLEEFVLPRWRS
jgi:hypothetical protein